MIHPADRTRRPTREERAFFEDLVVLRTRYAERGADDDAGVASVRNVIAAANAAMRRVVASGPRVAHLGVDAN